MTGNFIQIRRKNGKVAHARYAVHYSCSFENICTGFLSFLMDAFSEMEQSDSSGNVASRTVLHLHPQLAPVKVGVLSETQQRELCDVALQTSADLRKAGR